MAVSDPGTPIEDWKDIETSSIEDEFEQDIRKHGKKGSLPKKLKFKCPVENCDAAYRKNWLLEEHVRKHNKERPFVCTASECSKAFTKESHLKRHRVMVHDKACEQICDVTGCGRVFNNIYSLKKHKNKVHNENIHPFFCSECSKGFNKKWKLNQHMYIHTGEPPFKCTKCNLGFTLVRDLTKHNRNHKSYTCECGESFERWSLLRLHKKDACKHIVTSCKHCGTPFTRKDNLKNHYKVCNKDNNENFQCPYLDCIRAYRYKRNLNWHIRNTHEKDKIETEVFECTEEGCKKVFFKKCYLSRHVKRAHSGNPKPKTPRLQRKDKGKPKTYIAATLSGIKLSQKEHIELLKGNQSLLTEISETVIFETQLNNVTTENIKISHANDTNIEHINFNINTNTNNLTNGLENAYKSKQMPIHL